MRVFPSSALSSWWLQPYCYSFPRPYRFLSLFYVSLPPLCSSLFIHLFDDLVAMLLHCVHDLWWMEVCEASFCSLEISHFPVLEELWVLEQSRDLSLHKCMSLWLFECGDVLLVLFRVGGSVVRGWSGEEFNAVSMEWEYCTIAEYDAKERNKRV